MKLGLATTGDNGSEGERLRAKLHGSRNDAKGQMRPQAVSLHKRSKPPDLVVVPPEYGADVLFWRDVSCTGPGRRGRA